MNKSERKKEVRKSRIRILQKIQYSAFFLMLVEVVIWAATKMSPMLLVVILLTLCSRSGSWPHDAERTYCTEKRYELKTITVTEVAVIFMPEIREEGVNDGKIETLQKL